MADFARWVREEYAQFEPRVLLNKPITRLLDVSADAARALLALQVVTIGDLATSRVFGNAYAIIEDSQRDNALFKRLGRFSGDMLDKPGQSVPLADVPNLPLQMLSGVGPQTAALLLGSLPLPRNTITDLAAWPACGARLTCAVTASPCPAGSLPRFCSVTHPWASGVSPPRCRSRWTRRWARSRRWAGSA
ncbi:MAG: hypothetical protein HGA19_03010 [Oscillochloris sp.]|nr:hypothetical protein [Oscillochloris sp.]